MVVLTHLKLVIIMQSHHNNKLFLLLLGEHTTQALHEKPNNQMTKKTAQQNLTNWWTSTFSVCLFLSFHSTGQIFGALVCFCVLVCVFFFRSVRELKSINGPNVPHSFFVYVLYYGLCVVFFFTLPILCRSVALSALGPVAMASLNFCAYRVRTSTAKIYNKTVLLLRLLLLLRLPLLQLLLLLLLPFGFTVFLFLACKPNLPSSVAHHERPSHLRICEFFSFFRCCCAIRLPSSCFALLIHWENGV